MRILIPITLIAGLGVLSGCSNNNGSAADTNDAVFEDVLIDLVQSEDANAEALTVEDKTFTFPQDQSAFAGIFAAD